MESSRGLRSFFSYNGMKYKFFFIIGLVIVLLIALAWYFSSIFIYLVLSIVITTLLRPLVNIISKFQFLGARFPRPLSILASFFILIVVFSSFVLLFIPLIIDQIEIISGLNFDRIYATLSKPIASLESILIEYEVVDQESGFLVDTLRKELFGFIRNIDFTSIINSLISFTGSFFVGVLAVSFMTFFLLYENGILRRMIISLIPNQYFEVFIAAMFKTEKLLSNYLLGLLFQMMAIFSIAAIGLSIFGIKYALTIALFAAFANLIPYLGPILGATFGLLVGFSTMGNFELTQESVIFIVEIVSVFVVVQITDNVVLQPLIFSKSVKAHPLEIFIIIFVGATIGQIPGMIAAIPAYTIIRVTASEVYAGFKDYRVFQT